MHTTRVVESVDIAAPRAEVFQAIANCDRRIQLSPLWGVIRVHDVSPDFPTAGSRYHTALVGGPEPGDAGPEYDTLVTDCVPDRRFAYRLTNERHTDVTWTFQDVARGTRLIYEEAFDVEESGEAADVFVVAVRGVVRQWLTNIRTYAELRGTRGRRLLRWLADRFYLRLRPEQRRVILVLVAFQALSTITFVLAALAYGITRFLF